VFGADAPGTGDDAPPACDQRGLTRRRQLAGLATAALLLATLVPTCAASRAGLSLGSDLLLFLLVVVVVSLVGGFVPAFATSIVASLLLNYYFVPPIHRFTISEPDNILALVVFVVIASLVSRVVDMAARRSSEAARSNAEAETMSTLAGSLLRGEQALPALLDRVRETFAVHSVTLLRRDSDAPASVGGERRAHSAGDLRGTWSCVATVGDDPCLRPEDGDTEVPVGDDLILALRGRTLAAEDQRVLAAFATQVAVAYQQRHLAEAAEAAVPLVEADRMRTALLNAVSHDLRTPIASAKAAVSSLRSPEVVWSDQDRQELLTNADDALNRLTALVTNLLERVVANLIDNALRYTPADAQVRVSASAHGDVVELRVIDRGPGIPPGEREAAFAPFQRRDDHTTSGAGVGLGLAIARGFVEAMHGTITLEDTPGGGLVAVVTLPVASTRAST
jgi:two-component system sensor histidine kinase KdpD